MHGHTKVHNSFIENRFSIIVSFLITNSMANERWYKKEAYAHTYYFSCTATNRFYLARIRNEIYTNFHLRRSHKSQKTINLLILHLLQWISYWNSFIFNPLMCDFMNNRHFVRYVFSTKNNVGHSKCRFFSFLVFFSLIAIAHLCRRLSELTISRKSLNQ